MSIKDFIKKVLNTTFVSLILPMFIFENFTQNIKPWFLSFLTFHPIKYMTSLSYWTLQF